MVKAVQPQPVKKKRKKLQLTPREESFCQWYVVLGKGQESAKMAGYSIKNTSIGHTIMSRKHIQDRIAEIKAMLPPDPALVAAIAEVDERKRILTKIARTPLKEDDISANHVIAAVAEHNRMERIGTAEQQVNFNQIQIIIKEAEPPSGY